MTLLKFLSFTICILLASDLAAADDENFQCNELLEYDASTPGTVSSPFYGKRPSYHKGLWCEYRIRAPEGHRIKLTIKDIDIPEDENGQCKLDKLTLFSKNKKTGIDILCGNDPPKPVFSRKGENEINILFSSKSETEGGRGFLLEYESISENVIDDDADFQCGGYLEYDATTPGTVSSPLYGKEPYHGDLFCGWKIKAPKGYRIKVTFKDMDIDPVGGCRHDNLIIYSYTTDSSNRYETYSRLGIFCGNHLPRPVLSKEGENEIRVVFYSDTIVSGRGFLLEYESSPYFKSLCDEDGLTQCRNRFCYKNEQKCDGVDNCGDGTDEEDCGRPIVTQPEICGVQEIKPDTTANDADRIVGGQEAIPNSWPWQVSLQYTYIEPGRHFCGGTLINEQWVMTALHCISASRYPGTIKVRIGAHNLSNRTEYEQDRIAIRLIAYPDLENNDIMKGDMKHDIALLKLNAPVKFNKGVQPACLPSPDMLPQPGWVCYSTGWGETRGSGASDRLKQSDMIVKSRRQCGFHEDAQICVSKPYHSTCHGDSGSPINCKVNDKWYSYGALSLLVPTNYVTGQCAGPDSRTMYTSSVFKSNWIKETITKNS